MKKLFLLNLMLILAFSLSACGGSSGGGGGGPQPQAGSGIADQAVMLAKLNLAGSADYDVTPAAAASDALVANSPIHPMYEDAGRFDLRNPGHTDSDDASVATLRLSEQGAELRVRQDFDIPDREVQYSFEDGQIFILTYDGTDPVYDGLGLTGAVGKTEFSGVSFNDPEENHYEGDVTVYDKIALGGKAVGMQHSDFGVWKASGEFTGTMNGVATSHEFGDDPRGFYLGDTERRTGFNNNGGAFTGTALAYARPLDTDTDSSLALHGTAGLNVANSGQINQFKLDFVDYYTFTMGGMSISTDAQYGEFEGSKNFTLSSILGGAPGAGVPAALKLGGGSPNANLNTAQLNLEGNFYGTSSGNPSEAAGKFIIFIQKDNQHTDNQVYISGGFGVKK